MVKESGAGYAGGVDGLTLFLVAVVVLCTIVLMVCVDTPDQIHNPVEFKGVGRVVTLGVAAVLVLWAIAAFVH